MHANLGRFFKCLALIARGMGLVPVFIILSYLYSKNYVKDLLRIQYAGMIIVVIGGYLQVEFQNAMYNHFKNKKWLFRIIVGSAYLGETVLIIGVSICLLPTDVLMKFISCVTYIIMFGLSIASYDEHYTRTLSSERIVAISAIYIFAMKLCHYSVLGLIYILIIASYLFLNNQYKLEALLERTHENTPMLKKIRQENMKWVCLLMSIFVVGYPLRNELTKGLTWVWDKILALFVLILRVIIWILSFLSPKQGSGEPEAVESGFGEMVPGERNELLDFIFWIMVIGVTAFIIIKKRKAIIEALNNQIQRFQQFFGKAYEFLFGKRKKTVVANGYYEDVIEELSNTAILPIEKTENISKRSWQKQVKKYLKQGQSVEQYRWGYKLLLQGLSLRKINIEKSLTPREIMAIVEAKLQLGSIQSETTAYEHVRYGEEAAKEEELQQLKRLLKELLELNK